MKIETVVLVKDGDKIRVNVGDEARFVAAGYALPKPVDPEPKLPVEVEPQPTKAKAGKAK